jgi:DNA segregation ATPase FtsK/SpoIIIE-like protein
LTKKSSIKVFELQEEFNIEHVRATGIIEQLLKLEYISKDGTIFIEKINKLKSKAGKYSRDLFFFKAIEIIKEYDEVSSALLQRKLSIGYARAARLIDQLEEEGLIDKAKGSKPRKVL